MVNHMRHTRAHTANRRSHHALEGGKLILCPECKMPKISHAVCMNCGKYKGRVVIDMAKKQAKKESKRKERETAR